MELIFISFDSDYVSECENNDIEELQETINNIGSKWFFYPFPAILTDSGKSIKEIYGSFYNLETKENLLNSKFKGKRLKKVLNCFKELSLKCKDENIDAEEFEIMLLNN